MSVATVRTGIDSSVSSAAPNTHNDKGKWIRVMSGATTKYAYLFFKNPAPLGATVISATLRVYGVGNWGTSVTVTAQRIAAKWTDTGLTWNTKPGVTGTTVNVTQTQTVDATEWAFDVTALVQLMSSGAANYGFRLASASTTERPFYSLQAGDHLPVLDVEWSDAPSAPTELVPSGGAAVSVAKPVLVFNFHDVSGATAMQAARVQINPTNSFTAPAFDSGTVLTSDPEVDLAATSYAGITTGATAYWRVQVQDSAGLWSPWSTAAAFTRIDAGTLTINSPSGSVVEDSTPELIWTVAGATQTARRVVIADDANPTVPLLDTGRVSTSSSSYTVPKGVITSETATYRLTIHTWDDPLRVTTPGQKVYLEAVKTFTFVDDPTPDQVTALTVQQQPNGQPHMLLQWRRNTAPDSFSVWRDGVVVDTDLDPADLFVSGTTYQYVDVAAAANDTHTWTVRCKVDGVLGKGPTVTGACLVGEVWLTDVDTPTRLCPIIPASGDQLSFDMPEVSAEYQPVNGKALLVITQGQAGLVGSISGRIITWAGMANWQWVANLLWMKARPQNQLRLTVGGYNLRVVIRNVVVAPLIGGQISDRQVSFDFVSLDGVTQT